ncbi:hypothetical protein ISS03_01780 [Patescibacteria group bacterium]|nr:hypothetical protein [Patescibacteria group bacterium]
MLEFWKDGKKVEVTAIYGKGRVGQVVILDQVSYGDNPDLTKYPLAKYPQPYAFTIVEKVEGKDGYYVVLDDEDNRLVLRNEYPGASGSYLYDANEWISWERMYKQEKLARKERKIQQLEDHVARLKDTLVNLGFLIVSEEVVKKLGIA